MLRQPPLIPTEERSDAQRQALFPEQGVAAVARTHRNNLVLLRKVGDVAALWIAIEDRVGSTVELLPNPQMIPGHFSHTRHDPHVQDDIDRICQLDAYFGQRRTGRSHQVRNDKHRSAFHRTCQQPTHLLPHHLRLHPVIRRPRLFFSSRADVGALLHSRHIVRIGVVIVTTRPFFLIERDQHSLLHGLLGQIGFFRFRTIAPKDVLRLGEGCGFFDPGNRKFVRWLCLPQSIGW